MKYQNELAQRRYNGEARTQLRPLSHVETGPRRRLFSLRVGSGGLRPPAL